MRGTFIGLLEQSLDPLRYKKPPGGFYEVDEMIASLAPEGARVLDVGCGCGELMQLLKHDRLVSVVGLEPDPIRFQEAREKGCDVHCCTIEECEIDLLGQFDVVVFADVLEHLIDPGDALKKSLKLLKPQGFVIASIPNITHWSVRLNLLLGKWEYRPVGIMDVTHLRWFDRKGAERLFLKTGFNVVQVLYTHGIDGSQRIGKIRKHIIGFLEDFFPNFFGLQFIVKAQKIS